MSVIDTFIRVWYFLFLDLINSSRQYISFEKKKYSDWSVWQQCTNELSKHLLVVRALESDNAKYITIYTN